MFEFICHLSGGAGKGVALEMRWVFVSGPGSLDVFECGSLERQHARHRTLQNAHEQDNRVNGVLNLLFFFH